MWFLKTSETPLSEIILALLYTWHLDLIQKQAEICLFHMCGLADNLNNYFARPTSRVAISFTQHYLFLHCSFQRRQIHALLCLNNLVSALDTEALGGHQKLYTVWQSLLQLSTNKNSKGACMSFLGAIRKKYLLCS